VGVVAALCAKPAPAKTTVISPLATAIATRVFLIACSLCNHPDFWTKAVAKQGALPNSAPFPVRASEHRTDKYGRKAGSVPQFKYSSGFASTDLVWDDAHLDAYLTNPQAVIPGSMMPYKQAKPPVRQAIIAYLKEQH
jgi:hypothetical protein